VGGRVGGGLALAGVAFVIWFLVAAFQPFKGGGHGSVIVEIPKGASVSQIGDRLSRDHVISSSFFFNIRATLAGKRGNLHSGRYVLKQDMSYGAALSALADHPGSPLTVRVTVPEGASRSETGAIAKRVGVPGDYLRASVHSHLLSPGSYGARGRPVSLEGFLFPATYELLPGAPVSKLVNAQLTAFKQQFKKVDLSAARAKHLTAYDVLKIASMVEREAQLASERPLIAAVIYNRLHARMPLGIDATIRYAIGDYSRPLTGADLLLRSAYNTRRHRGLPPTPIGSPGLASIEAAAHPANVPYVYYVVKPGTCGQHAFSATASQFQRDVAAYDAARAAKGGRSPTTCSQ